MSKNFAMRRVGSVLVLRQNGEAPNDDEWNSFLSELGASRSEYDRMKILIYTAGGGPTPAQRKKLENTLGPQAKMPVAVISDDLKTRFVASTIALFHKLHRSFTTKEVSAAYDHLKLSPSERRGVEEALGQLGEMIG